MEFAKRIQNLQGSATLNAKQKSHELAAKGIKVIDLSAGEPSFETPKKIKEACKQAIDENWSYYGPTNGYPELRSAIAGKLQRDNGITVPPDQIVITCGAKQAIFAALQILINPGDEVLIPAPYWVSYPEQVKIAEGKPVILSTDETTGFKISPEQLTKAITKKTRLLLLNNPSNPTGACYDTKELQAIGAVCRAKNILVLSDEIYDRLTYDGFQHTCFLQACPELAEQTLLVNGASKTYAMTGWRMGYIAGPKPFIEKMKTWQGQELTTIASFIQRAAITAFADCDAAIETMRKEYQIRRDLLLAELRKIKNITCDNPKGAFFLFPNCKKLQKSSEWLAEYLLEEAHVAVVAGEGFGAPGYLRLSFVADRDSLKAGAKQIGQALAKL